LSAIKAVAAIVVARKSLRVVIDAPFSNKASYKTLPDQLRRLDLIASQNDHPKGRLQKSTHPEIALRVANTSEGCRV
jgi:hypothetical protein